MRNQTWNQQGQLLEDMEIIRVDGVPVAIDRLAGLQRPATAEETGILVAEEQAKKVRQARERAIAAIKVNKGGAPWGTILFDLAVAQGLIEE